MSTFDEYSIDELARTIEQLHGVVCAAQRELLAAVAAYDRREAWRDDGATSMAAWVAHRLGVSYRTAAGWARVGGALASLPGLDAALGGGALSFDQVAPLTKAATPMTDEIMVSSNPNRTEMRKP